MSQPSFRRRWPRFVAGTIHDLHRLKIPFARRVVLPLNTAVIAAHLRDLHYVFARHGITFWLRDGTALGAVRDGAVIPHDDDADLGMWTHDAPKLDAALAELARRGFTVYQRDAGIVALLRNFETVDICISGDAHPDDAYGSAHVAFFRALRPVAFLGLEFNVPRDTERYLEFCYGADWRVPKFGSWWSHSCWLPAAQQAELLRRFAAGRRE